MAEQTDAQVRLFSNSTGRPTANVMYTAYFLAKELIADYDAGTITALMSGWGNTDTLLDGAETDGRTRVTKRDLLGMRQTMADLVAFLDADASPSFPGVSRISIMSKIHTNSVR